MKKKEKTTLAGKGVPHKQTSQNPIQVRFPADIRQQVEDISKQEERKLAQVVVRLVRQALENKGR